MGRYYSTANGDFDGKFWFGVQPSDDPEIVYGMRITGGDGSFTDYEADSSDMGDIMKKLDEQFDKLGVPKEERRYRFENAEEVSAYVWDDICKYFLQEEETYRKDGTKNIPWACNDKTLYPISDKKVLAASRVSLGLRVANDIRLHGVCQLNAEF